jgi:hypothetical protein
MPTDPNQPSFLVSMQGPTGVPALLRYEANHVTRDGARIVRGNVSATIGMMNKFPAALGTVILELVDWAWKQATAASAPTSRSEAAALLALVMHGLDLGLDDLYETASTGKENFVTRRELADLLDKCADLTGQWDGGDVCDAVFELAQPAMIKCPACDAWRSLESFQCWCASEDDDASDSDDTPTPRRGAATA